MRYLSVTEIAKKWDVSERSVRNYCAQGRVNGAFLTGKTWNIPENVEKPERSNKKKEQPITLLDILQEQKNLQQHWKDEQDYLLHCGMKDLLQLKQTRSLKNAG